MIIHISSIQRTLPLLRLYPCVRCRQGGADELQQGALEGGRAQRDSGEHGRARLYGNPGRARYGQRNRATYRQQQRGRTATHHGCTRRNSARPAEPPRGSGRTGRIPRLGPSICHQRKRVCNRRGHDSDDLTSGDVVLVTCPTPRVIARFCCLAGGWSGPTTRARMARRRVGRSTASR